MPSARPEEKRRRRRSDSSDDENIVGVPQGLSLTVVMRENPNLVQEARETPDHEADGRHEHGPVRPGVGDFKVLSVRNSACGRAPRPCGGGGAAEG